MDTLTTQTLPSILNSWQAEDVELAACVAEVRDWMEELSQFGIPHFGETALRLLPLRKRLVQHFKLEDEILSQLMNTAPDLVEKVAELHGDSKHGHEQLLEKLDDLTSRLKAPEPPFESWQAAIKEIEMFVELLEQHERDEAASLEHLLADH